MTDWQRPTFARIETLFCAWLLVLSFTLAYAGLDAFVPVLWKPIPPFGLVTPTAGLIIGALWAWRLTLVACILFPGRVLPLVAAAALGFFCLGLRSCFGLQPQLFATLELSMLCLLAFALMSRTGDEQARELAFVIKLVCVLFFFSAGVAKVRFGGINWAFSGIIERSLRMLYPMNRDALGFAPVLEMRRALLANTTVVRIGAAAAHLYELIMPMALLSKRASRVLLAATVLFLCSNIVLLGINFYTLAPMLITWGLWDVTVRDLARARPTAAVIGTLTAAQLGVTLLSATNLWPLMLNDMYARPSAFPPVEAMDFALIDRDGGQHEIDDGDAFLPFSRFHIAIALLRQKDRAGRDALVGRVLEGCSTCTDAAGIAVNWKLEGAAREELARASAPQHIEP